MDSEGKRSNGTDQKSSQYSNGKVGFWFGPVVIPGGMLSIHWEMQSGLMWVRIMVLVGYDQGQEQSRPSEHQHWTMLPVGHALGGGREKSNEEQRQ